MRGRVCRGSGMAVLALYASYYRFGFVAGVAVEAAADFGGINYASRCFFDVAAGAIEMSWCEIEGLS
jgi:hypothetical protein